MPVTISRSSNSRVWKPARTSTAMPESAWPLACCASISSQTIRASSSPSQVPRTATFSPSSVGVHRVLPRRPRLWLISPEAAARICGVER